MLNSSAFTILVGTDFSEGASRAIDQALELATLHDDCDVHVVHVLPEPSAFGGGLASALDVDAAIGQVQKSAAAHRARLAPGPGAKPIRRIVAQVRRGGAARAIAQLAADLDADLVVVGSHGRRGLERFLLGSVAERVSHLTRCPVWIVRPKDHATEGRVPEIQPTCADCLEARRASQGSEIWCARHSEHHLRAHTYSYVSDGMYGPRTTAYASTPGQ